MTVPVSPVWDGKENAPGRLVVTLANPWNVPVSGEIRLGVNPETAATLEFNCIKYALKPQEKSEHVCEIRLLRKPETSTSIQLCMKREPDQREVNLLLPWHTTTSLPAYPAGLTEDELISVLGSQSPCRLMSKDSLLAEVRLAVHGQDLIIQASVRDAAMRLTEKHWDGSCLEIFAALAVGARIGQLIMTPATATEPAGVWRAMPNGLVPAPEVSYKTSVIEGGYVASGRIPLHWLLGTSSLPETFLFEMAVTAGINAETMARATLFNSANSGRTAQYAVTKIEKIFERR
jgi:hypothetical protein